MYKIDIKQTYPCSKEDLFRIMRDNIEESVKYLPNLRKIEIASRENIDDKTVKMECIFDGSGNIPFLVRSILKPNMIKWKEIMIWKEENWTCEWEIETYYFNENFTCKGISYIKDEGEGKSSIHMDGFLKIHFEHFPGIPDKIAQGAGKIIEKFIGNYLDPNMKKYNKAILKLVKEKVG